MEVRFYRYIDDTMKLTPSAIVDDYSSFVFTRSYSSIGTWQMVLPLSSKNIPLILVSDIIHVREGLSGLITKIKKDVSEGNETITISGVELKGLIRGRIVIPDTGKAYLTYTNADPGALVINLISEQLLIPEDNNRRVPGTVLRCTTNNRLSYNGRFSSLEEDVEAICTEFELGFYATLNSYREIKWVSFEGKDRRISQNENSKMIFSYTNDTLESSELEITKNNINWILVAGQGEGTDRITTSVGSASGLRRFEGYVDARDVEDPELLTQRGHEKIAEYGDSVLFSARISELLVQKYRIDFDLGDLCTITDFFAGEPFSLDARITSITECYEDNALTIDVTFGYDKTGLGSVISRLKTETKSLKNKE